MINQENALVSIIVPIYGTEKYLKKCVDSIVKQTYRKLEIILVNDGSPDNSYTIMQEYQRNDVRVKIVNNSENLGLFRARLEGARVSNGDYLMFVDSDDYMGIDFVRLLVNAAESEQADIVKAQFVMEDSSRDYKYVYNYINNRPRLKLEGEKIAEKYFQQEGMDFSWHVVWGKIYSRVLWKKCEKYYRQIKTHLIMTEDIAYSTPLFVFAKKYIEIDCDTYFYVQRNDASTGISRNIKKFEKNIQDLKVAFDFREEFLKKLGLQPIFEEKKLTYIEKEIYKIINKGVADFTNDYMERFYKYLFVMPIRNYDASLPFEFLMERASDKDRDVFSCCYFEDDIFFGDGKVELSDWWKNYSIQQESREHIFEDKKNRDADRLKIAETFYTSNRWKRVMVLALLKPDALKEKMKRLLKKNM